MANETHSSAMENRAALAERLAQLPADKRKALRTLLEAKSTAAKPIPRRDPAERIPLTYSQQRLWIVEQLLAGSTAYNETNFIRLPFELNEDAFRRALNEIVRRHEILRSTIVVGNDDPCQRINPFLNLEVPVIDLRRLGPAASEPEALRLSAEESERRFDLGTGPLVRAALYRLDAASYLFALTIHHIACDGWSMGVLAVELSVLYWSYVLGRPSPLPELPIQYGDFAVWQRRSINDEVLRPQLAYWRTQLSGLPKLELPADRPRPAQFTYRGERFPMVIEGELFQSFRALSAKHNATMHITLLAALFVLLHKYAGQDDIAVGVPIAGRNRMELEPLIGFFVNTLVMRVDLSGDPSFSELLARVRQISLAAYANQDVPFERLVEELHPARDPSRNPLVQIIFQLFQPPSCAEIKRENVFALIAAAAGGAKFDLAFELVLHPEEVRGFLEYNVDLFDSARVARLVDHLTRLLKNITANPNCSISKLDLAPDEERRRMLVEWNATQVDYPRDSNVAAEFLRQAETGAGRVAVEFGGSRLTYGELRERARALASELSRRGVKNGDAVGLLMERSLELPAAMLGILWTGAFYVPLDPRYPADRLSYLAADSGARQIVTTGALYRENSGLTGDFVFVDETRAADDIPPPQAGATDVACLLYTSGTTGGPKGVAVNHRNILRLVKNTRSIRYGSDDSVLHFAPITFDASLFEIWGSLLNGGKLAIHPPGTPLMEDLAAFIRDSEVTLLFLTTNVFRRVIEDSVRDLRHVRQIITGGEVLPVEVARAAWTHLPRTRILNAYGPTECVTFSTLYEITDPDAIGPAVPIGRPVENTTAYIVDAYMNLVPIGIPGELVIGGDAVANEYWRRPEATARSFIANPFATGTLYRTGDRARYRADGNIEFLGRRDRQIKLNGYRIELEEVEAALLSHPGVSAAASMVLDAGDGQTYLAAFVEAAPGQSLESAQAAGRGLHRSDNSAHLAASCESVVPELLKSAQDADRGSQQRSNSADLPAGGESVAREFVRSTEVRGYLETVLPRYMVPSRIEVLAKLPLTTTGKVDLLLLARQAGAPGSGRQGPVAPRTAVEKLLANIWKAILHLESVGIDNDFFALGGQSLIATRVLSRVRDTFQTQVTMREFFDSPTIRGLSALVERNRGAVLRAELLAGEDALDRSPGETVHSAPASSDDRMGR